MQILKNDIKDKIIEAAVNEFSLNGYEKASMRDIARAAGISVSNTYNYYRNKAQLFETIIEPVYQQVKTLLADSLKHSGKRLENDNILAFIDDLVKLLMQMDARQRQLLIIMAEKSAGTRYAKAREDVITLLKMHLAEAVRRPGSQPQVEASQGYILTIIAANYIDGLMKIMKDYRSREWAEENIRALLTYHLNGIKGMIK
jgi:AcrR family transcriptional regulator